LFGVFDMARFLKRGRLSFALRNPLAAAPFFSRFLFPLARGVLFPATQGMGHASDPAIR
jgi:hypothetical protein